MSDLASSRRGTLLERRLESLVRAVELSDLTYTNEAELQQAIGSALHAWTPKLEVKLEDGVSRIDLWIDGPYWLAPGIGIEVKIKGSAADTFRQLERYAANDSIGALILVTTQASHHHIVREINGKPVRLVSLIQNGL